jgi:hypothetical protein
MLNIKNLIAIYDKMLDGYGTKTKADLNSKYLTDHERLSHLIFMLDSMKTETDEGKLNRWIGFIQGVLWANSWCTIDDLRKHVISCTIQPETKSALEQCWLVEPQTPVIDLEMD